MLEWVAGKVQDISIPYLGRAILFRRFTENLHILPLPSPC